MQKFFSSIQGDFTAVKKLLSESAEEIMIKMSIEDKISNLRGFTFSNLLGSRNKIDTIFKNQKVSNPNCRKKIGW